MTGLLSPLVRALSRPAHWFVLGLLLAIATSGLLMSLPSLGVDPG